MILSLIPFHQSLALNGTWNNASIVTSNWSTQGNWIGGNVAEGAGSFAYFNYNLSGNRTIVINTNPQTLGVLNLGDPDGSNKFTISASGGACLIMDNNGAGAKIDQLYGSYGDVVSAPILLKDGLTLANEATTDFSITGGVTSGGLVENVVFKTGSSGGILIQSGALNNHGIICNLGTGSGAISLGTGIGPNVTEVIQQSSSSMLILSGLSTDFTGQITLRSGTLRAKDTEAALGAGSLRLEGGTLQLANNVGLLFKRDTVVAGDVLIQSDRLQGNAGPGVTHTLGALSIGAQTLTVSNGSSATSGTAGLVFGAVSLTGSATFNTSSMASLKFTSVSGIDQSFCVGGSGTTTISGMISTGSGGLYKTGAGLLLLSGSNNFTGGTTLTSGTIRVGNANALGGANSSLNMQGGCLDLNGTNVTISSLSGNSGAVISTATSGAVTLTIAGSNSSAFAGAIQNGSGTISLAKTGSNVLSLSGLNSYTGQTVVTEGKLLVSGSLSGTTSVSISGGELEIGGGINQAATVLVGAGGSLSGNGAMGSLVLNAGGTLSPGASGGIGQLNIGSLSGTTGAVLSIQLGATNRGASLVGGLDYDQIVSSGGVSLGGMSLSLSATDIRTGDLFVIILNGGSGAVAGIFVDANGPLIQGKTLFVGGQLCALSYAGDAASKSFTGGNDVVLLAVPEPEPLKLAMGACAAAFFRWAVRRKSNSAPH